MNPEGCERPPTGRLQVASIRFLRKSGTEPLEMLLEGGPKITTLCETRWWLKQLSGQPLPPPPHYPNGTFWIRACYGAEPNVLIQKGGQGVLTTRPPTPWKITKISGFLAILVWIPCKSQSCQASIQCLAIIGTPAINGVSLACRWWPA